jgi:hypothetical protein
MTAGLHQASAQIPHRCMHKDCTAPADTELYSRKGTLEGLFCAPHARQRTMAADASADRQRRRAAR